MASRGLRSGTAEAGVGAPAPAAWPVIAKDPESLTVRPNLVDYDEVRASFSWEDAVGDLDGLPGGGLNIAHEAVDRHAAGPRRDAVALRFVGTDLDVVDLTYAQLVDATDRFANMLDDLGVRSGDRVFALMGRIPALYVAALGTLKHASVFCPLFPAFGPEPIRQRIAIGDGVALVTTPRQYDRKVAGIREALPTLRHVLVAGVGDSAVPEGTTDLDRLLATASPTHRRPETAPDDLALVHFTSGTTGTPKGAMHVHGAVVAHHATARYALDLHGDDVYWCTADPGWVTGTSYGIVAPLTHGITSIVDTGEFDAARWYRILERLGVTVWYTAPTAIRRLMRAGADVAAEAELSRLRFVASVGEPLNPEAVEWGASVLGHPLHDNWWQTETGAIMIANFAASPIRPGSMGRPVPGVDAAMCGSTATCDRSSPTAPQSWSTPPTSRACWRCGSGGRRCSAGTCTSPSATPGPSPIVTYGGSLPRTLAAAEQLAAEGISAEVIDLRTLRPLDADAFLAVGRTHRVVIVDEGWRSGSISAEISARIAEHALHELDAPILRICAAEVPMPYLAHLELAALPQPAAIVAAGHAVVTGNA